MCADEQYIIVLRWSLNLQTDDNLQDVFLHTETRRVEEESTVTPEKTWHPCATELHMMCTTAEPDLRNDVQPMLKS